MYFLKRLLTWWNSQTIGTQIFTSRKGVKVGEDESAQVKLKLIPAREFDNN